MTDTNHQNMFLFGFFPDDIYSGEADPCYFGIFSSREAGEKYLEKFRTISRFLVSRSGGGVRSFTMFGETEHDVRAKLGGEREFNFTNRGPAYRMNHDGISRDFYSYFVEEVPFLG